MTVLLVFHFSICTFLVFVILLQPGKGDAGIGFGSSSQSIFGSRGAGNFLTKLTSFCAVTFLITSLVLTRARMKEYTSSVIPDSETPATSLPATGLGPAATPAVNPVESAKPSAPETGESKK